MRGDHPTGARSGRPREQRLAQGRRRFRVAIELAGIAIGQELPALVDQEQGRPAGHGGGAHRRVVDRDDQGVGCQPVLGHGLAPGRIRERDRADDDIGLGRRGASLRDDVRGGDAGRGPGRRGKVHGPLRMTVVDDQPGSRQDVPDGRQMAVALHPGPHDGDRRRSARAESGHRDGGHGSRPLGGDRTTVEDRRRPTGRWIAEHDDRGDGRQAARPIAWEPGDPLDAEQVAAGIVGRVVVAVERAPGGGHGMGEGARRARVDAHLGRQLGIDHECGQGALGEGDALRHRRHGRFDLDPGQVHQIARHACSLDGG